jgi:xylulose-5-phosphate/fructose-6-phosphate phosphoketolase
MEGAITRFSPQYSLNKSGLESFIRAFSIPGGFPSHVSCCCLVQRSMGWSELGLQVNAETPGAIHEGGELGYCLAVASGSIMDKPDLIAVAVIGDGESETGPTATAWHAHKVSAGVQSTGRV